MASFTGGHEGCMVCAGLWPENPKGFRRENPEIFCCDPKGHRALLRIPSTEGRGVRLCSALSKPKGPKGGFKRKESASSSWDSSIHRILHRISPGGCGAILAHCMFFWTKPRDGDLFRPMKLEDSIRLYK